MGAALKEQSSRRSIYDQGIELLRCPVCQGTLSIQEAPFRAVCCQACGRRYPIVDNLPILIPERATFVSEATEITALNRID